MIMKHVANPSDLNTTTSRLWCSRLHFLPNQFSFMTYLRHLLTDCLVCYEIYGLGLCQGRPQS